MCCDTLSEQLTAHLESALPSAEGQVLLDHLRTCEPCRIRLDEYRAVRERILESARALPASALENSVMAAIRAAEPAARKKNRERLWRWGLATAGASLLTLVLVLAWTQQGAQAWSIEQSIEAARPFRALRLDGTFGGNVRCRLWARSSGDGARSQRTLIRIDDGPTVWTEGNATYTLAPGSRVVYVDDALTLGFSPWPGARLFELVKRAGVRTVDTRWHFPAGRSVVVEWSLMSAAGPTSAVAEFDVETKLLVGLRQWDNMDRRGTPGFEVHDITYLEDLPDDAFSVDLPPGVTYRPKDIEVAEATIGLLSLDDAGVAALDLTPEEASRRIVTGMWDAMLKRDLATFKTLCPVARAWPDRFLSTLLGSDADPDAVVEVLDVEPGVQRGRSRLGPLSVVTSRVRRRDGGLYEDKIIVQHRLAGRDPSCVIYSHYGHPFRLE